MAQRKRIRYVGLLTYRNDTFQIGEFENIDKAESETRLAARHRREAYKTITWQVNRKDDGKCVIFGAIDETGNYSREYNQLKLSSHAIDKDNKNERFSLAK